MNHPALFRGSLAALALGAFVAPATAQVSNSAIAPSGQELVVDLTCNNVVDEGDVSYTVTACATLTPPTNFNLNVVFVIDVSGSMEQDAGAGGDINGDGLPNSYLDAAVVGLEALLDSMPTTANIDIGVVAFSSNAVAADVMSIAGDQGWTSPVNADGNGNLLADIKDVLRTVRIRGTTFSTFTPKSQIGVFTNYTAALAAADALFDVQAPGEENFVYFISDGMPNVGNPFLPTLMGIVNDHGAIIHAYGIGVEGAAACALGQPLNALANVSGGSCTAVVNPANLATILPQVTATVVDELVIKVNGNPVVSQGVDDPTQICITNANILPFLDEFGPNTIEACGITADGLTVTAVKLPVLTACLLYSGFEVDNKFYGPHMTDKWYLKPRLDWTVTEAVVPTFTVPLNPALMGRKLYFQVFMHNQVVFPNNAVQMSNAVSVEFGGPATTYGTATGIVSWFTGSTAPGANFQIKFDVLGM
jgi:hypothetical protein